MDGEVFFRKSAFGGFNREDVMKYISQNSVDQAELKATKQSLEAVEKQLELKNAEVIELKSKISRLEDKILENQRKEAQSLKAGFDTTADKLMRDSMAYAQQYVDSAELMAKNIREDIVEKVSHADVKVTEMLDSVNALMAKAQEFDASLKDLKSDFEAIQQSFEEDDNT